MEREELDVVLKMPDLKVLDVLKLMANPREIKDPPTPFGLFQLVQEACNMKN